MTSNGYINTLDNQFDHVIDEKTREGIETMLGTMPGKLSEEQKKIITRIIADNSEFFRNSLRKGGQSTMAEHTIETGDHALIRGYTRRRSPQENETIDKEVSGMLEAGVLRKSSSLWTSPVVLVKKKDGTTRFCVDYRKLNAITAKDCYPLPRIEDVLEQLSEAEYISTYDLTSGYWQVPVAEKDRPKTAFNTR